MLKVKLLLSILLITLSFKSNSSGVDSLTNLYYSNSIDSIKAYACIKLSTLYENKNTDSSIAWLNRGLMICRHSETNSSGDLNLYFLRGVFHNTIAQHLMLKPKNFSVSKLHIDSAMVIFENILAKVQNQDMNNKTLDALSLSYSLLGDVSLFKDDPNEAINFYSKAIEVQEKSVNGNRLPLFLYNLGQVYHQQGNNSQAIICYQKALELYQKNNDSLNIAQTSISIATVAKEMGVYDVSLNHYSEALSIFTEKEDNKKSLASAYLNIGDIHLKILDWAKAMFNYREAKGLFESISDNKGLANSYLNIGICFNLQNNLDSSLFYLAKSKNIFENLGDRYGLSNVFYHLGEVYFNHKGYPTALKYYQRSEEISLSIGLTQTIANCKHRISQVLFEQNKLEEALGQAKLAMLIANENKLINTRRDIHFTISQILEKQNAFNEALYHYKQFFALFDSINSLEKAQQFSDMETLYQLEQKQRIISQLEKEKALQEIELSKAEMKISWQRFHSLLNLGVLIFLTFILLLLYRQFRLKRAANLKLQSQYTENQQKTEEIISQKEEIESQRNEVERQKRLLQEKSDQLERFNWMLTDSIDYASSIQAALMPVSGAFKPFFSDNFLMFFPKDVVSGDFYWCYPMNNTIIVALADCTGHGVPGGFMSMLGISALTELMGRGFNDPAEILNNLRLLVIESFKQTGRIGEHQDGMEMSVIKYTIGDDFIDFAGANLPIWIISKNSESNEFVINEQKGNRMPVSFHFRMEPFTSYRINVKSGDQIYLFSDGFRDQLGGERFAEKYGKERFQSLLLQNAHKPMDEQKSILEDAFFRWVGGNDQLDDITIIGFRI